MHKYKDTIIWFLIAFIPIITISVYAEYVINGIDSSLRIGLINTIACLIGLTLSLIAKYLYYKYKQNNLK